MTISAATARSRRIRQDILRTSCNAFAACPDVGLLADQIYEGFSTSQLQYGREEIDAELVDMIDDGLLTVGDADGFSGAMPKKIYRSTSRGRDFHRAGCPWDKIDEFTGAQK